MCRPQGGFILLLAAILLGGVMLGTVSVVRLVQQSQEQLQVQHVAEHAAEALATIAARDLNFKAITNRAMLANEVVIGQLLGLNSWFMMTQEGTQNLALLTAWVPYVNVITRYMDQIVRQMEQPLRTGIEAAIFFQQSILRGLEGAQFAFHQASWMSTLFTVNNLLEASHPDYELALLNHQTLLDLEQLWVSFQSRRSDPEQQQEYASLASASRDPFSTRRTYRWFRVLVATAYKAGASEVYQRHGNMVWQSIDTLSIHERLLLRSNEHRFGAGAYYIAERLPNRHRGRAYGDSYRRNPSASRSAARRAREIRHRHRVPYQYLLDSEVVSPSVTVVVRRPEIDEKPLLWAAGRAHIEYQRHQGFWPRADRMRERPNLHNALWRVKPGSVSEANRLLLGLQV